MVGMGLKSEYLPEPMEVENELAGKLSGKIWYNSDWVARKLNLRDLQPARGSLNLALNIKAVNSVWRKKSTRKSMS